MVKGTSSLASNEAFQVQVLVGVDVGYVVTAAWQIVSLPVRVRVPLANLTLEPDGQATGCNPVEVGSIPTGVFLKKALAEHAESAEKKSP